MTTVTPSDRAGAASAKRPATIPTQRSGQTLRLLVLGSGDDAAAFRARAAEAGVELAQRFSVRVTHVVVEAGVGDDDARVARARGAGLPVLGLLDGARLVEETMTGAGRTGAEVGVAETVGDGDRDGAGFGVEEGAGEQAEAGSAAGLVEEEVVGGQVSREVSEQLSGEVGEDDGRDAAGGPSDEFAGSAFEAMLQFPPLPTDESGGGEEYAEGAEQEAGVRGAEAEMPADVRVDGGGDADADAGPGVGSGVGADADVRVDADVDGDVGARIGAEAAVGVVADGGSSVLMDEVAEACACAEAEAGMGAEAAGDRVGVACGPAGVVGAGSGTVGCGEGHSGLAMVGSERGAAGDEWADAVRLLDAAADEDGESTAAGRAASVAWALVPLVSLGLLTPIAIGYASYRLRSRALVIATGCYAIAIVAALAVPAALPVHTRAQSVVGDLMTTCLAAAWLGGTAHAFMLRRKVFGLLD